jgi:hypothetical protein
MNYINTARDIYKSVNSSVNTLTGGKVNLNKIGEHAGKKLLQKVGKTASSKFHSLVRRKRGQINNGRRVFNKGRELFNKTPEFLSNVSKTVNDATTILNQSPFASQNWAQSATRFAGEVQTKIDTVQERHNQIQDNLNPSNLKMNAQSLLETFLADEDSELLKKFRVDAMQRLNQINFNF